MSARLLFPLWIIVAILLLLYSYTQVDLSLTLSQSSVWQVVQKSFQYIGWFQRPLSTGIYVVIISLTLTLYLLTLLTVWRKEIGTRELWKIIIVVSVILLFSYNAFSYDHFNYIFDAKIVTFYQQNPYVHKALDFTGDPMLSFMRWTHRTYPYGPTWLALTIPVSFIGSQIFIITFYLFKAIAVGGFLLTIFFIHKIAKITRLVDPKFAIVFFALNPLVINESLISGHNDIVMMAIALAGVYFLIKRKIFHSILFLVLSVGVKFVTAFLIIPFMVYLKNKNPFQLIFLSLVVMIIGVILVIVRTNFQPWYLLYILSFAALISNRYYIFIMGFALSLMGIVYYIPFIYTGNWNDPIPFILNVMVVSAVVVSVVGIVLYRFTPIGRIARRLVS